MQTQFNLKAEMAFPGPHLYQVQNQKYWIQVLASPLKNISNITALYEIFTRLANYL